MWMQRRGVRSRRRGTIIAAIAAAVTLATGCQDVWETAHTHGPSLVERPECPTHWGDSIPWMGRRGEKTLTWASLPNGQIPGAGPITNIPEFHDCQRFLAANGTTFDSLFAIFASFRLASVVDSLPWDTVTWSSSNAAMATVSAAGRVTGVAHGDVTITASSHTSPGVFAARSITVVPEQGGQNRGSIDMHGSHAEVLEVGETRLAVANFGRPTTSILSVATIYAYAQRYAALGIEPNFNCLYLYFDRGRRLRARMIPVASLGPEINACLKRFNPESELGTELAVVRTEMTTRAGEVPEYPPVARWDWDPVRSLQTIGIACGKGWCTVGQPDDAGRLLPAPIHSLPLATSLGDRAVVEIKGWHDEQLLAAPSPNNPQELRPSNLRGTVIPHPQLGSQVWDRNGTSGWKPVAYIAVTDLSGGGDPAAVDFYRTRLNLDLAPVGQLDSMNELSYCYGRWNQCGVDFFEMFGKVLRCRGVGSLLGRGWYVNVKPAGGGPSRTYCLIRRTHDVPNLTIPSTARWRWILRDDTIWTECIQGCCETHVGAF